MNRKNLLLIILISILIFINQPATAVEEQQGPFVFTAAQNDLSPALRDMPLIPPEAREARIIFNYFLPLPSEADLPPGSDPVIQDWPGYRHSDEREILANFEGIDFDGGYPPDTNGDVGPDHFFQMVNSAFQIWDKDGNNIYGPASNETLWQGFGGLCESSSGSDPIVLYDHLADRWLATNIAFGPDQGPPYYECLAISETEDPTGAWFRYGFNFEETLPDYPKFAVWPDGYYMTANEFGPNSGTGAFAFEREAMLAGDPEARAVSFLLSGIFSFLPSDLDGPPPPAGTPNYFVRRNGSNQLQLRAFGVDWLNTDNSYFTSLGNLITATYDYVLCPSGSCVPQPDVQTALDAISDRVMWRLQYRNFDDYQTMVVNHTVDAGVNHAAVRWYELRDYGDGWDIHQQSTYAPDEENRWMGSIAMNGNGDIAIGYSVSSESTYPSIRFTGRQADDPPGIMTFPEITIMAGSGSQSGITRWGDYSMTAVDPVDDYTFWHTNEYLVSTSGDWHTRTAAFTLGPIAVPDFEPDRTTGHAPLTVEFTDSSVGYPDLTSWTWDFDDDGSIDSEEQSPTWTYDQPGNYTVSLTVSNDTVTETITRQGLIHVFDGESALLFDGQESYVSCLASSSLELTDAVTVEAWIRPAGWGESGESGFGRILEKGPLSFLIYGDGSSLNAHSLALLLMTTEGTAAFICSPEYTIDLDQWQHVAVTYDGGSNEVKLYIGGDEQELSQIGGQPVGSINDNSEIDLLIGNSAGSGQTFDGVIDEVRVWNLIRSGQDIEADMYSSLGGGIEGLVGSWQFNEGYGQWAFDLSGNDNVGIVNNTAWVPGVFVSLEAIEDEPDQDIDNLGPFLYLSQNYPNPCFLSSAKGSPVTTIGYNLSRTAQIRLRIYNPAGQVVKSLVDGLKAVGWHEAQWDGTNQQGSEVASGIYLYQLETVEPDLGVERKRLVLLK